MKQFQFESPNYTQTPNDLFDHLLKEIEDLSELKVTLMAVRMTEGYHQKSAELSVEYLQKATGLARNSVRRGLALALQRGTIRVVTKATNREGGVYALNVRGSVAAPPEGQPVTPRGSVAAPPEGQPVTPLKKPLKKELKKVEESEPPPTDFEKVWSQVEQVFIIVNPSDFRSFVDLWEKFPDFRRHNYAIERARKANPRQFRFYLKDFASFDPQVPRTWGQEFVPSTVPAGATPLVEAPPIHPVVLRSKALNGETVKQTLDRLLTLHSIKEEMYHASCKRFSAELETPTVELPLPSG